MSTMHKIVVGLDGSEVSKVALRWAAEQARRSDAALHVVTAWESPAAYRWTVAMPLLVDFADEVGKVQDAAIGEVLGDEHGLRLEARVVEGRPAATLLRLAADADLLVIGSCGHGEFAGMLLGSVSLHCVTHAPCPVVVVPPVPSTD